MHDLMHLGIKLDEKGKGVTMADFDSVPDDFSYNLEDDGQRAQSPEEKYVHPIAVTFHLLFKVVSIVVYLLCSLVFGSASNIFIITFIVVVLLMAADFWTVSSVSLKG